MKRIVLFHGGCNDGFMAAAIAKKKFGNMVTLVPMTPNESTMLSLIEGFTFPSDSEIYSYDVSYTQSSLDLLFSKYPYAKVFDHHKTTLGCCVDNALRGNLVVDIDRSGAMLAWNHLYPSDPAPLIVSYIQDRDLFKHTLPSTDEVNAWFWNNYRCEFDDIHRWIALLHDVEWLSVAIREGGICIRTQRALMDTVLKTATYHTLVVPGTNKGTINSELAEGSGGVVMRPEYDTTFTVACVESALFRSDLGAALYNRDNVVCDFALIWRVDLSTGKVLISLRSKSCDVEAIARMWGGGGHKYAAGCEMSISSFFKLLGKI